MSERSIVFKIVKIIESEFPNVIAYAYLDNNTSMTETWWSICIDNWELYHSAEFKEFSSGCRKQLKKKIKLLFCYCNPLEKKLLQLAEDNNLLINCC